MGLYIQKNENQSELQQRIAAELREKAARAQANEGKRPDGIDDSKYVENTKKTTSLAWAWGVIVVMVLIVLAVVVIKQISG